MILYRMYSKLRFNRPINKETDCISPGGYEFKMNGKDVSFDFVDYSGSIQANDTTILHCEQRNPDVDSFEDIKDITLDDLKNVDEIIDFYVDSADESLAFEILNIEFEALVNKEQKDESIINVSVPLNVIKKYNRKEEE